MSNLINQHWTGHCPEGCLTITLAKLFGCSMADVFERTSFKQEKLLFLFLPTLSPFSSNIRRENTPIVHVPSGLLIRVARFIKSVIAAFLIIAILLGTVLGECRSSVFLYGYRCARSELSRHRADIVTVRPSHLVNKIYHKLVLWIMQFESFHWLGHQGNRATVQCSTNIVSERVIFGTFLIYVM